MEDQTSDLYRGQLCQLSFTSFQLLLFTYLISWKLPFVEQLKRNWGLSKMTIWAL